MSGCKTPGCGSYAINHNCHGRDGSDGDLCDVCYWRKREKTNQGRITQLEAALVVARGALEAIRVHGDIVLVITPDKDVSIVDAFAAIDSVGVTKT